MVSLFILQKMWGRLDKRESKKIWMVHYRFVKEVKIKKIIVNIKDANMKLSYWSVRSSSWRGGVRLKDYIGTLRVSLQ